MSDNKENNKRKIHEKLHRNFMQMNELDNILQMEREIFEESCKKTNEELDRKRLDIKTENEALTEIVRGKSFFGLSISYY